MSGRARILRPRVALKETPVRIDKDGAFGAGCGRSLDARVKPRKARGACAWRSGITERRRFPWLPVVLGVGCESVICIGVLVVGGGAALFLRSPRTASPIWKNTTGPTPMVGQHLDDYSLFDDFSSDELGWPRYDDGTTRLAYEDEAYGFQITEPDYYDWAYFPMEFFPNEIRFDVRSASTERSSI
jgi:hypothetical protein